ncbi:unnamed protein product [Zymoseptoria tritici ST99CH_3D1]|nr:unnamed protein product [Zymoseptoria tritici ST99CH_3D1]
MLPVKNTRAAQPSSVLKHKVPTMAPCYLLGLLAELTISIFCALVPDLHITIRSHTGKGPHRASRRGNELKRMERSHEPTRLQKLKKNVKPVVEVDSLDEIMAKEEEQDEAGAFLPERFWVPDHVLSSFRTLDMRFGFELVIRGPTTPANASFIKRNRCLNMSFHATDVHMIFDTLVNRAGDMLDPLPTADDNSDTADDVLALRSYHNFSDRDLRLHNDTKFEAAIDILSLPAVLTSVKGAITESPLQPDDRKHSLRLAA